MKVELCTEFFCLYELGCYVDFTSFFDPNEDGATKIFFSFDML